MRGRVRCCCTRCLALTRAPRSRTDDVAVKALFRRAKAHEGRGDADAAQADFRRVAELQPHNADAQEEVRCVLLLFACWVLPC